MVLEKDRQGNGRNPIRREVVLRTKALLIIWGAAFTFQSCANLTEATAESRREIVRFVEALRSAPALDGAAHYRALRSELGLPTEARSDQRITAPYFLLYAGDEQDPFGKRYFSYQFGRYPQQFKRSELLEAVVEVLGQPKGVTSASEPGWIVGGGLLVIREDSEGSVGSGLLTFRSAGYVREAADVLEITNVPSAPPLDKITALVDRLPHRAGEWFTPMGYPSRKQRTFYLEHESPDPRRAPFRISLSTVTFRDFVRATDRQEFRSLKIGPFRTLAPDEWKPMLEHVGLSAAEDAVTRIARQIRGGDEAGRVRGRQHAGAFGNFYVDIKIEAPSGIELVYLDIGRRILRVDEEF